MSKEEKKKLYKEFENDKEASFIYFKAHKIFMLDLKNEIVYNLFLQQHIRRRIDDSC